MTTLLRVRAILPGILVLLTLATGLSAADKTDASLGHRLAAFNHVGLRLNSNTGAYSLYVYTDRQQAQHVKTESRIAELRTKLDQARPGDNMRELEEEYARTIGAGGRFDSRTRPETFYTLLSVGEDFLEIKPAVGTGRVQLLPLRMVSRIYLPELDTADKPESPTKP